MQRLTYTGTCTCCTPSAGDGCGIAAAALCQLHLQLGVLFLKNFQFTKGFVQLHLLRGFGCLLLLQLLPDLQENRADSRINWYASAGNKRPCMHQPTCLWLAAKISHRLLEVSRWQAGFFPSTPSCRPTHCQPQTTSGQLSQSKNKAKI